MYAVIMDTTMIIVPMSSKIYAEYMHTQNLELFKGTKYECEAYVDEVTQEQFQD